MRIILWMLEGWGKLPRLVAEKLAGRSIAWQICVCFCFVFVDDAFVI